MIVCPRCGKYPVGMGHICKTSPADARPTPWAPPPEGFHYEVATNDSLTWRLATEAEADVRGCRYSTWAKCHNRVVAALLRGRGHGVWWFYCPDHMYGRWIEDGQIVHWRLVEDADA